MLIARIEGSNLLLVGSPEDGIVDIHALVDASGDYVETTVAFEPTPAELCRLNLGHPVYVTQLGNTFHPIRVEVKS